MIIDDRYQSRYCRNKVVKYLTNDQKQKKRKEKHNKNSDYTQRQNIMANYPNNCGQKIGIDGWQYKMKVDVRNFSSENMLGINRIPAFCDRKIFIKKTQIISKNDYFNNHD